VRHNLTALLTDTYFNESKPRLQLINTYKFKYRCLIKPMLKHKLLRQKAGWNNIKSTTQAVITLVYILLSNVNVQRHYPYLIN
jgi:hypothetical protein